MRCMKAVIGSVIVTMMLGGGLLMPQRASSQGSEHLQHVEKQLADKQAAAETHRKQLEGIKDPQILNTEMRKHFQMTEEILALMLERRKLIDAQVPKSGAPTPPTPAPSGGMPPAGRMGGEHGGGPMSPQGGAMGGTQGAGGGMMQKEMGGMQGAGGGMMEKEMGGMQRAPQSGSMPGMGGAGSPSAAPAPPGAQMSDMDQMMKRIAEHSSYMETIQDPAAIQQEMLRHQKMLDQMLRLMQ